MPSGIAIYELQNDGHNIPSNCHHFVLVAMYVSKIKLDPTHWNVIKLVELLRCVNLINKLFILMVLDILALQEIPSKIHPSPKAQGKTFCCRRLQLYSYHQQIHPFSPGNAPICICGRKTINRKGLSITTEDSNFTGSCSSIKHNRWYYTFTFS